jgi:hypothetical protein
METGECQLFELVKLRLGFGVGWRRRRCKIGAGRENSGSWSPRGAFLSRRFGDYGN